VLLFVLCALLYPPYRFYLLFSASAGVNHERHIQDLLEAELLDIKSVMTGMLLVFWKCFMILPILVLALMRVLSGSAITFLADVYLMVLKELDPKRAEEQAHHKVMGVMGKIPYYLLTGLRLFLAALFLILWYHIPYIGTLALPLVMFYFAAKSFGLRAALLGAVLFLVGSYFGGEHVSAVLLLLFKFWVTAVQLSRDLMEPYFERLDNYKTEPARIKTSYYRMMFGYALPFALLGAVPLFGMLVWGVAQAGVAALVVEIEKKDGRRRLKHSDRLDAKKQKFEINWAPFNYLFMGFELLNGVL